MRLWRESAEITIRAYPSRTMKTAGYVIVINGHAELEIEGQTVKLEPGDSWVIPKDSEHRYRILDDFTRS